MTKTSKRFTGRLLVFSMIALLAVLATVWGAGGVAQGEEVVCPPSLPGDPGAPQITSVVATIHPNNSLIFNFSVEVDRPAQVWVQYQLADASGDLLQTPLTTEVVTSHSLQVMRLRADMDYCYHVFAIDSAGGGLVSNSVPGSFRTGLLPVELSSATFTPTLGKPTYALTLLDFNDTDFEGLVSIDADANLVWYYQHDAGVFAAAQKDNYNLVFGQLDGVRHVEITPDGTLVDDVFDTLEDGTLCAPEGRWHHESLLQPGNQVYFIGSEIQTANIAGVDEQQTGDTIMIWDQDDGSVTQVFSQFDVLDPATDRTSQSDATSGFFWQGCDGTEISDDWTHSNSLWVTDEGNILMSIRHLNQVIAIKPDFSGLVWRLGGPGSDFSFPNPSDQFYMQHTAKELPNGNILLFDNGNVRPVEEGGAYSRALELELDFNTMEARKVWEYRHSPDLFASCCSSVVRLDNGNSVIVFGQDTTDTPKIFNLVEADSQGNAVSIIEISSSGKTNQYRAYPLDSINGESEVVPPPPSGKVYGVTTRTSFGTQFSDCFRFASDGTLTVDTLGSGTWQQVDVVGDTTLWRGIAGPGPSFMVVFSGRANTSGQFQTNGISNTGVRYRILGLENPACTVTTSGSTGSQWSLSFRVTRP